MRSIVLVGGFVSDSLFVYRIFLWIQTWIYIDLQCILVVLACSVLLGSSDNSNQRNGLKLMA